MKKAAFTCLATLTSTGLAIEASVVKSEGATFYAYAPDQARIATQAISTVTVSNLPLDSYMVTCRTYTYLGELSGSSVISVNHKTKVYNPIALNQSEKVIYNVIKTPLKSDASASAISSQMSTICAYADSDSTVVAYVKNNTYVDLSGSLKFVRFIPLDGSKIAVNVWDK